MSRKVTCLPVNRCRQSRDARLARGAAIRKYATVGYRIQRTPVRPILNAIHSIRRIMKGAPRSFCAHSVLFPDSVIGVDA